MMLADISMCYKDPNHPGPGYYFVDESEDEEEKEEKYVERLRWRIFVLFTGKEYCSM